MRENIFRQFNAPVFIAVMDLNTSPRLKQIRKTNDQKKKMKKQTKIAHTFEYVAHSEFLGMETMTTPMPLSEKEDHTLIPFSCSKKKIVCLKFSYFFYLQFVYIFVRFCVCFISLFCVVFFVFVTSFAYGICVAHSHFYIYLLSLPVVKII